MPQAIAVAKKSNYAVMSSKFGFTQKSKGDCNFHKFDVTKSVKISSFASFIFRKQFPLRTDVDD